MKLHFLVSIFFLLLLSNYSVINSCYDDEREALLSFKSNLTDPSNRLSSWQGLICCNWHGIRCSDTLHVVAVDIRNPNPSSFIINMNSELVSTSNSTSTAISGTISPSLFSLTHLRYLDLSFNNFMLSKIPTGFANLTRLTYLNLSNAMFSDSITSQFANLTSVKLLDLSCSILERDFSSVSHNLSSSLKIYAGALYSYINGGNLSSSNLNWLQGLRNLRELILSGVDLSVASQSPQWAKPISVLSNLRRLQLSNCRCSGKIPADQFLNLTQLYSLLMDFNFLTCQIPGQLANLTSLSFLDLTNSNLQGSIPYLPQLKKLSVGSNSNLTVDLNSLFLVPWVHLEFFDIQSTHVIGSIPNSLANVTSLVHFIAYNCLIEGPIPPSITNLSRLESLELDFNKIVGQLSPSISSLKGLQLLSLMQNSLEGPIPDSICNISALKYLTLSRNSFTGKLPDCINQLHNLRQIQISGNKLNGTIPSLTSLFQNSAPDLISLGFSGLTVKVDQDPSPPNFQPHVLELISCKIEGSIPNFISKLTKLEYLSLAINSLSGTIPSWLFNLPNLGRIDLSFNNLHGVLPPNIQLHSFFGPTALDLSGNSLQGPIPPQLENIEAIDLSGNNFTGVIPAQIGLGNIRYLSFSGNRLFGQVPPTFCHANNDLMLLDLSNNSLVGPIPTSLGNCKSLIVLNLRGNNLSGELPNELEGAKNLSYLDLSDNHFNGPFPSFIQKLQKLMILEMGNNKFEGTIPQFIGDLQNLHILVLKSNSFSNSIPQEISKLAKLQYIDFSSNKLSGPIPENITGLEMLRTRPKDGNILGYIISVIYFRVELNMVSKRLSQKLEVVRTYHSGIDLSWNALTGSIPSELGLLQGLFMLNLSHNGLSGEIPESIGEMAGLESLDLSFNNLGGEIPTTLTLLDSLSVFNLSYNNLSGTIPTGMHFDTLNLDGSAYIGNKFLCDTPDGINCNGSVSTTGGDDEDATQKLLFYGIVTIGYGVGFWGLFGVLYLMKEKWRRRYWKAVDGIASRIITAFNKD